MWLHRTTWCVFVVAIGAGGCGAHRQRSGFGISEPMIAISVSEAGDSFRFAMCSASHQEAPVVRRLEVTRKSGEVVCRWKQPSGAPLRSMWFYGSDGARGPDALPCKPLEPGVLYEIWVDGSGSGSLQFSIDEARHAAAQDRACTLAVDFER